jgi:predicted enzyme related to lactoylglutathione lyase
MPFDGKRMIMGGFDADRRGRLGRRRLCRRLRRAGARGTSATPIAMAAKMAVFREHGATRVVEAWGDDVREARSPTSRKRGEGRGRRERRLLLDRMADKGPATRLEEDHGRRAHEARARRDAVRRQAHVLGRLRADPVSWHELYSSLGDKAAFDFYSGQFGWETMHEMDMGPMGTYRIFGADGVQMGGMMNKPDNIPASHWGFYVNVDAIDAAAERVKAEGGQVLMGPHEVPGGSWIVQCVDPQGVNFALVSLTR